MFKKILMMASIIVIIAIIMAACKESSANKNTAANYETNEATLNATRIKKGEYLVSIVGCDDCHSPKKMGAHGPEIIPELRLSGYPAERPIIKPDINLVKQGWSLFTQDLTSAVGPWGRSFSANITSDKTGIGNWPEESFITAIRKGKFKGLENSRGLLPPMPWPVYKNMNDEDLKSIYAYLKTVPPVENVVPAPVPLADMK